MRALSPKEMAGLYRFTKGGFIVGGIVLIGYGSWIFAQLFLGHGVGGMPWFGIFPMYVGAMLILIAAAMKEDWFTNARRYW